jgi:hypothetical protein
MRMRAWSLAMWTFLSLGACNDNGGCDGGGTTACCKTCTAGKACGDSCIPQNQTCNAGPGCACNGFEDTATVYTAVDASEAADASP